MLKKLDEFGCDVLCWLGIHKWETYFTPTECEKCIYCGKVKKELLNNK